MSFTFRGIPCTPDWPEKLAAAQAIVECRAEGKTMTRLRYGEERDDWGAEHRPCHDCVAIKGELHVPGCDVERCPNCGGQFIGCDCECECDE